jgi:hypothetical protein
MSEISKILAVSYQIIFSKIYSGGNFQYARARALREECVTCIFELMIFRQQVRASRYQLLEPTDWHSINTLFYVMSRYDNVQKPRPTLQKRLGLDTAHNSTSWQNQFAELHIVARFDMLHWPSSLHWVVGSYVHGTEAAVTTRSGDFEQLHRTQLVAYCYADQPAGRAALAPAPGPAVVMDFSGLSQAIHKDCMDLLQAKIKRDRATLPARFKSSPDAEHFVLSDLLLRGMQEAQSDQDVESGVVISDLRIYIGFENVFSLLDHMRSDFAAEERLIDVLARRSAQIAADRRTLETSGWSLLLQNENTLRLCTQENSFTTPMSIGSLVAYSLDQNDKSTKLAMVNRIFRPTNKHVVIDLSILAHEAEAVLMTLNAAAQPPGSAARVGKPAVLLRDLAEPGRQLLMFPPQDVLPGIDKIELHRQQSKQQIALKSWRNATHDFYLYTTESGFDQRRSA